MPEVEVILADAKALRQRTVLWSCAGKLVIDSDGRSKFEDESPASKRGPEPLIELTFSLAAAPELGRCVMTSHSWSWADD